MGSSTAPGSASLLFVDRSLANAAALIADWQGDIQWIEAGDGIAQISAVLADRRGLASVQILSHGSSASLQLGSTSLGLGDLEGAIAATLAQWGQAIAPDGDLLLYGCNVAAGDLGQAFVQRLASLTGADVAASNNLTGQGGDWQLEVSSGTIDARFVDGQGLGAAAQGYGYSLASIGYSTFSGATGLTLNGAASLNGNALSLTPDLGGQRGSVFANQALAITGNTSFSTQFQFKLDGTQGSGGADGFVFMLQNTAAGVQAIGDTGGGMGYLGTGTGSLAIKFDTYRNFAAEPSDNFIGVLRDGSDVTPIAATPIAIDLNSGLPLNAWIDYDGTTNQLQVFVSQTATKPAASLTTSLDLAAILGTQAYAGFSAGTGGLHNSQGIQSWQLTTSEAALPPPNPTPVPTPTSNTSWQQLSATAIDSWLQAQGIVGLTPQPLINTTNDFETFNAALTTALNGSNFNKVTGTAQGDYVPGTAGNDWLQGLDGGDFIRGFGGNNAVNAGTGNDLVITEGGNDYLIGGAGNDNLESDGGNDLLFGGDGNDNLKGQSGNDLLAGGAGDDVLEGGDDNDLLIGGSGNDRLYGNAGNDRLFGGAGTDFLWGGEGVDTFQIISGEGADFILDFQDGIDKLALSGLTFDQIAIEAQGSGTVLRQRSNGQILATINDINAAQITQADFETGQPTPTPNPGQPARYAFLGAANYSVTETAEGSVVIATFKRTGDLSLPTVMTFNLESGTAQLGLDFTLPTSGNQVTFAAGSDTATILIPILDDTLIEGPESFSITVISADNASLLSPRTAQVAIADNDLAPNPNPSPNPGLVFNYGTFNGSNLDLNGSATISGGALVLTPALGDQGGSAFNTTPLSINANTSFNTQFQFQLSGGQGTNGADGFTFILQNTPSGSGALGTSGGGMGYLGSGSGSLAIKFDTYKNPTPTEPNDNFIGVLRDGDDFAPLAVSAVSIDLNSGLPINAWIDYDGGTNQLRVYLSNTTTKPGTASLTTTLDLAGIVGNRAFAGFSAGTGGLFNNQAIQSWQLSATDGVTTPDPTPNPGTNAPLKAEKVVTQLNQPTAIDFSPTGDLMFIAEKGGAIKVVKNGQTSLFLDLSDQVNSSRDRGLLSVAVDPNFYNGRPYIYALYTYDPPETANYNDGTSSPDGIGNRPSRLMRIRADASQGYLRAVADTAADLDDRVLLLGTNSIWAYTTPGNSTTNTPEAQGLAPSGIVNGSTIFAPANQIEPGTNNIRDYLATDSESHTIGTVRFGPDGALYVSNGDGTSYNVTDRRTVRVQDLDNLSGKVLRISPDTGKGLADNPFFNGNADSNRSKVYQYGLRNPFRFTVNPQNNQLVIGDVGWTAVEEINSAPAGANFGWPYYEGTATTFGYRDLPGAAGFYASNSDTDPVAAFNHTADGYNAVLLGDFNTGSRYGTSYQNALFFANTGSLNPLNGTIAAITFNAAGQASTPVTIAEQMPYVVNMKMGPDGYLYYVQLLDQTYQGSVGRWTLA